VGAAAVVTLAADGSVAECKLVLFSVGDGPVVAASVCDALKGVQPAEEAIRAAADAVDGDIDPPADIHAAAAYRRHLAKVLARRTLARALERIQ
jgi:aerobic carbon-monoxide dehydrogenase medium subunit